MANAYPSDDEDIPSDSLTQMSDEVKEMFCEQCEKDFGTHVTADGFCADCVAYLCSTCLRYHKKHLPEHNLQDSTNMPLDFCYDKCPDHPGEIIKFYCKLCVDTACQECRSEKHGNCSQVCHIPTMVESVDISDRLKQINISIEETCEEIAVKQEGVASNLKKVDSNKKNVSAEILKHKATLTNQVENQHKELLEELNQKQMHEIEKHEQRRAEILDKLEQEKTKLLEKLNTEKQQLVNQLNSEQKEVFDQMDKTKTDLEQTSKQMNQNDMHRLHLISSETNVHETEVKNMRKSIKQKMRTGEKCGLFVELIKANHNLAKLRSKELELDHNISNYMFQPNKDIIDLKSSNNTVTFGSLIGRSKVKRTVTRTPQMILQSENDEKSSYVSGLCECSGYLVVADNKNRTIKIIDIEDNSLSSSVKLYTVPFDVTCVDADKVATTLPQAGKIQFLSVTNAGDLSMADDIVVGKPCYGIEYLKPYLLVACHEPGCVHIMSASGHTIKTLTDLFEPMYITVNPNKDIFYVLDIVVMVVHLSFQEQTRQTFTTEIPVGLSVDNAGSVYTVTYEDIGWPFTLGNKSKPTLYQLSARLEIIQRIDIGECCTKRISSIFCNRENKLYVGTNMGSVHVFELS